MKRIIALVTFEAYVPEDMKVSQVQDIVEKEVRNKIDGFSIYVKDYQGSEDDQCPMFDIQNVMCGTETMIGVGGD